MGGGGKAGSQSSTTTVQPPKYLEPYLRGLAKDTKGAYTGGDFEVAPYSGQRVAELPGNLSAAWGMTADRATGNPLLGNAENAVGSAMNMGYQTDQLQAAKEAAIADIMPGINASFAGSGMAGGTGHQEALAKGLARGIAPIEYGAMENAQNRALSAAGMAPGLDAAGYAGINQLTGAGAQEMAYGQSLIDSEMGKYYESENAPYDELTRYSSMLLGQATPFLSQTGKQGYTPGLFDYLGMATSLGGAAMMSDARMKTDIRRVGETDGGLPVYTFRYKAGGPVQMGVMAQDVEKVKPDAVIEIDGVKHVKYAEVS